VLAQTQEVHRARLEHLVKATMVVAIHILALMTFVLLEVAAALARLEQVGHQAFNQMAVLALLRLLLAQVCILAVAAVEAFGLILALVLYPLVMAV
jgi:hypothetical protein